MNRALRLVWVLLLALALPLQGLAAATMAACGPAHGDAGAHAVPGHEASAHETHRHDPSAHHSHRHDTSADDGSSGALAADDTSSPTTPDQKCSVCASCCTASAGLPTHAVVAHPVALAGSLIGHERASLAAFLTDGPERPPRSFLA